VRRHLAEASLILDELAEADAKRALTGNKLVLAELRRIGVARTKNLCAGCCCSTASGAEAERLAEGLRQLFQARDDASVRVVLGACELRRYAGCAYVLPLLPDPPRNCGASGTATRVASAELADIAFARGPVPAWIAP